MFGIFKNITQYAHDVVLTSMRRRFNVMALWTLYGHRVLTGEVPTMTS